jgi:hypothetical protein
MVLALTAPAVAAANDSLLISQFRTAGVTNGDFVELLNISNSTISLPLHSWSLFNTRSDDNAQCTIINSSVAPAVTLQPGQHYLIGDSATGATVDATLTQYGGGLPCSGFYAGGDLQVNPLLSPGDMVSYGSFPSVGPAPVNEPPKIDTPPSNGNSLRRLNNGYQETESNSADFASVTAIPQNSSIIDPTLSSNAANPVKGTSATLNASVDPHGQAVSDCHFDYGTTTAYGSVAPCSPSPSGSTSPVSVSAGLTGLNQATTYHFRVSVKVAGGTFRSADKAFTTPALPVAQTDPATAVQFASATLNGSVNPKGVAVTDCHFDYGTTTAYGSSIPCNAAPSGSTNIPVGATATGLAASTLYHFRVVLTTGAGTANGLDQTFSTAPAPPGGTGGGGTAGTGGTGGTNGSGGTGATSKPNTPRLRSSLNRRKHSVTFTFTDAGVTGFQCALVKLKKPKRGHRGKPAKPNYAACRSSKRYIHLRAGRYKFYVRGFNSVGAGAPNTFSFRM